MFSFWRMAFYNHHLPLGLLKDRLLSKRENIASTHALFETYNDETIELIRGGSYKLILDEVFQAVQTIKISPKDLQMLQRDMIEVDPDYRVRWVKDDYEGRFEDLRDMCMTGNVILYNNCLLLWKFPVEVFQAFDEVVTEEDFNEILYNIDCYERFCEEHPKYQNNRAVHAIRHIKKVYDEHLENGTFLKV